MGNLLITSFIVQLQENHGVCFSICLVVFGLCLNGCGDVGEFGENKGIIEML